MSLPFANSFQPATVMAATGAASACCSAIAFSPPPVLQRRCSLTLAPTVSRRPHADGGAAAPVVAPCRRRRRAALVAAVAGPDGRQHPEAGATASSVEADAGAPQQPVPSLVTGTPDARPAAVPAGAEHDALPAPVKWVNGAAVGLAVGMTDWIFAGKEPVRRFWVLEVVARCPYFSYLCVLHCYESLGLRLRSEHLTTRLRAHFAEADNEAMHTQVMEGLGGGSAWLDRFIAQHVALVYFWLGVVIFAASPAAAYDFNRRVEEHAFHTYDDFLASGDADAWKDVPAPAVAAEYYARVDCLSAEGLAVEADSAEGAELCAPVVSLYDVFVRIRDDEAHHAVSLGNYGRNQLG
eukprot:TRINITY_DN2356_c0_g1_i4.p1 TRINITY_DN2356_c0_g1~~TRINITY_DN2356_c0_g1_i4.p1  ORF type:complete len:352 (+),score=88.53 TRINITY_DN2356_c0_g1_i4:347-1402(+)